MAFRKPQVQIHVPTADPGEQVVKQMEAWRSDAQDLLDERNRYKERAEYLLAQFDSAKQTIERLGLEHDHSYQVLANERDYYRKAHTEMVCICGELMSTINGMISLSQNAAKALSRVAALVEHLPMLAPVHAVEAPVYDGNGMPVENGPDPLDLDGIRKLAEQINRAQ